MMTIGYETLVIGAFVIVMLVACATAIIVRRPYVAPNLRDQYVGTSQGQPVYIESQRRRSSLRTQILAALIVAAMIGVFWAIFQSHPWTDRHGHTIVQWIACDVLEFQHDACDKGAGYYDSQNEQQSSARDDSRTAPIAVKATVPGEEENVAYLSAEEDDLLIDPALPLPIVAPQPKKLLPPEYFEAQDWDDRAPMDYDYGIDPLANSREEALARSQFKDASKKGG